MLEISDAAIPWHHIHPILVNFSAALVPSSVACDLLGRFTGKESFRSAAWWTLFFAAMVTPLTVVAGWFWKSQLPVAALPEDLIIIHQWLGTALALLFFVLTVWRGTLFYKDKSPNFLYLAVAAILTAMLAFQGNLGGKMVFG